MNFMAKTKLIKKIRQRFSRNSIEINVSYQPSGMNNQNTSNKTVEMIKHFIGKPDIV